MKKTLFGTDGIRGEANIYPMTSEIALYLGKALANELILKQGKDKNLKIVIGKDTRISGYMFETALVSGIVSAGVDVFLVGPMPTPAIAHLTKSIKANAGIMITASHNPSKDNGIKIFNSEGFKLTDSEELEIEKKISLYTEKKLGFKLTDSEGLETQDINKIGKAFRLDEAKGRYIEFAKSTIKDFSLSDMKIVLDCANGAAYEVAPKVFRELGAEVIVLNNTPDGLNINDNCGAVYPENTAARVVKEKANVGITLDGDSDRLIVCDEKGEIIDGDYILTFCALQMLKNKELNKNTLVVTDYSNLAVDDELKFNEGKVVRTPNGDRYVIEEMREKGYNLGGENSGHIIFSDYVTTGDGIISALQFLKMVIQADIKVSEIKSIMTKKPQVLSSFNVNCKKPFNEMEKVSKKIDEINSELNKNGRLLLRYSGTENKCRIMIEGDNEDMITKMNKELYDLIYEEIGK